MADKEHTPEKTPEISDDTTPAVPDISGEILDIAQALSSVMIDFIKSETSPEIQQLKLELLRRIVNETEVKPTRIPYPKNITEVGGYYNLLQQTTQESAELQQKRIEMQLALIASALGLPM